MRRLKAGGKQVASNGSLRRRRWKEMRGRRQRGKEGWLRCDRGGWLYGRAQCVHVLGRQTTVRPGTLGRVGRVGVTLSLLWSGASAQIGLD